MKIRLLFLCILAIGVAACAPAPTGMPSNQPMPPTYASATRTPAPDVLPSPAGTHAKFIEPDPETYVTILPAVLKYFYYRKQAMISGHVEDLWAQYPELRNGTTSAKGVNAEGLLISNYQGLKLFDGNIFPEEYERFQVKQKNDEIEVLVHGMELYLFHDENRQFNESGGEFKIVLYLRRKDGHWDVFKTDEVTQSEWQEFSP